VKAYTAAGSTSFSTPIRKIPLRIQKEACGGEVPRVQEVNITAPQMIKQWKKFLSQSSNETSLIRFLVEEWKNTQYVQGIQPNGKELYITCEEKFWKISGGRTVEVPEICSCHSSTATCKVVMTQWWSAQKIPMCLDCVWPFLVPLMPVCSKNVILKHAQS